MNAKATNKREREKGTTTTGEKKGEIETGGGKLDSFLVIRQRGEENKLKR